MVKWKEKIASQAGASISYALLLFLVCAVTASIVLTAGTAASGRLSGYVDNDQRYYSVTSASDMLIRLLDGLTVETQTVQTGSSTENMGSLELVDGWPVFTKDGETIGETELSKYYGLVLQAVALYSETAEEDASFPAGSEMAIALDGEKNAVMEFSFEQEKDLSESGRFIFKISSYDGSEDDDSEEDDSDEAYTLYLVFDANIEEIEDSRTKDSYSEDGLSTVVTKTITTQITWTLTSMTLTVPSGWETES